MHFFWKVNNLWWQKRCGRNDMVYILLKYFKLAPWVDCKKNNRNTITALM